MGGSATSHEKIYDRYWAGNSTGSAFVSAGPSHVPRGPSQNPSNYGKNISSQHIERTIGIINDLWKFYQQGEITKNIASGWETHFHVVKQAYRLLSDMPKESDHQAWNRYQQIEQALTQLFSRNPGYGTLSRKVFVDVLNRSTEIHAKIKQIEEHTKIGTLRQNITLSSESKNRLDEADAKLKSISPRLENDWQKFNKYKKMAQELKKLGQEFYIRFQDALVQRNHRTELQNLNRFRLNKDQERFVAMNYDGERRIQGTSGSGKTIILIHRALRLAMENPQSIIRIFTINRSLAEHLTATMQAIHGELPENLHIAAYYDMLLECLDLCEFKHKFQLKDPKSSARISVNWLDFCNHPKHSLSRPEVISLLSYIEKRGSIDDPKHYLWEELIYIQSATKRNERNKYCLPKLFERKSRSIPLNEKHRKICLEVLEDWDSYLSKGFERDIDGVAPYALELILDPRYKDRIKERFKTDYVFLDEFQDFSTIEMMFLRELMGRERKTNQFFMVGDLNQKVYVKHHDTISAEFKFTGRSRNISRNYRNTRQILEAAYQIPYHYPPASDEKIEITKPEPSSYEGGRPIVIRCTQNNHLLLILKLIMNRREQRVAIVSEDERILNSIKAKSIQHGLTCHELFRNEDLDFYREQSSDSLNASVCVSRLEAIKGLEFDTVIVAGMSAGIIPSPNTPQEEKWREAAIVYVAMTRARDELIITFEEKPSEFLEMMDDYIDYEEMTSISDLISQA